MSNGLTLPFSQTLPFSNVSAFEVVVQTGGGIAIDGESYGADQFGDTGVGIYGETDIGQAIFGIATGSGVAGAFQGAVQVTDAKDEDAFGSTSWSKDHAAVAAHNNNGGFAFWGNSDNPGGTGIYARGAFLAARFDGATQVNGTLAVSGALTASGVNLLSSLKDLQGSLSQLQVQQAEMQQQQVESDGEAAGTQAQVTQLVGQVSQLSGQVSQLASQVSQLNQLASAIGQIGQLQSEVGQLQSEVSTLLSEAS